MLPRPIVTIRTVEVTSRCNLACVYCIHPTMTKPKIDMSETTWTRVKVWVQHLVDQGTQGEINLSGVGEPTLHPDLARYCAEMREILGPGQLMQFTTNGKTADLEALARALRPSQVAICVTNHHAHLAGRAAYVYAKVGLLREVSNDPTERPMNWAGQVPWHTVYDDPKLKPTCWVLRDRYAHVEADGSFVICCQDGAHETVRGSVYDDPRTTTITVEPWRLCPTCWQVPPED